MLQNLWQKETSGVLAATKEDRGNLTFLPLRHLAFSASMLHSSTLLNLVRNRVSNHIPKTTIELN